MRTAVKLNKRQAVKLSPQQRAAATKAEKRAEADRERQRAEEAVEQAREDHAMGIITQVAKRFIGRFPLAGLDRRDLEQEGYIVLMKVRAAYQPERGDIDHLLTRSLHNRFSTLLKESWRIVRVRGRVKDHRLETKPHEPSSQEIIAEVRRLPERLCWPEAAVVTWLGVYEGDIRKVSRESGMPRRPLYQFRSALRRKLQGGD